MIVNRLEKYTNPSLIIKIGMGGSKEDGEIADNWVEWRAWDKEDKSLIFSLHNMKRIQCEIQNVIY